MSASRRAVFLDRDGVIIEDREDYVRSWEDVAFIPSAFAAIRKLTEAGIPIVLITNQSAVGRGYVTSELVEQIHTRMLTEISSHGGSIDGVYYCPHHPDVGCDCRKPAPGMLFRAAAELGLDLASSIMVGDAVRDIKAAETAGASGILVLTGKGRKEAAVLNSASIPAACPLSIAEDIGSAVDFILEKWRAGT